MLRVLRPFAYRALRMHGVPGTPMRWSMRFLVLTSSGPAPDYVAHSLSGLDVGNVLSLSLAQPLPLPPISIDNKICVIGLPRTGPQASVPPGPVQEAPWSSGGGALVPAVQRW